MCIRGGHVWRGGHVCVREWKASIDRGEASLPICTFKRSHLATKQILGVGAIDNNTLVLPLC